MAIGIKRFRLVEPSIDESVNVRTPRAPGSEINRSLFCTSVSEKESTAWGDVCWWWSSLEPTLNTDDHCCWSILCVSWWSIGRDTEKTCVQTIEGFQRNVFHCSCHRNEIPTRTLECDRSISRWVSLESRRDSTPERREDETIRVASVWLCVRLMHRVRSALPSSVLWHWLKRPWAVLEDEEHPKWRSFHHDQRNETCSMSSEYLPDRWTEPREFSYFHPDRYTIWMIWSEASFQTFVCPSRFARVYRACWCNFESDRRHVR